MVVRVRCALAVALVLLAQTAEQAELLPNLGAPPPALAHPRASACHAKPALPGDT